MALRRFASEHEDKFPEGETAAQVAAELIEHGYLEDEGGLWQTPLYVCPSAAADVKAWRQAKKPTEDTVSYAYVMGLDGSSPPDFPIASDRKPDNHAFSSRYPSGRSVLSWIAMWAGIERNCLSS